MARDSMTQRRNKGSMMTGEGFGHHMIFFFVFVFAYKTGKVKTRGKRIVFSNMLFRERYKEV